MPFADYFWVPPSTLLLTLRHLQARHHPNAGRSAGSTGRVAPPRIHPRTQTLRQQENNGLQSSLS